jgi:hypothetical protein
MRRKETAGKSSKMKVRDEKLGADVIFLSFLVA